MSQSNQNNQFNQSNQIIPPAPISAPRYSREELLNIASVLQDLEEPDDPVHLLIDPFGPAPEVALDLEEELELDRFQYSRTSNSRTIQNGIEIGGPISTEELDAQVLPHGANQEETIFNRYRERYPDHILNAGNELPNPLQRGNNSRNMQNNTNREISGPISTEEVANPIQDIIPQNWNHQDQTQRIGRALRTPEEVPIVRRGLRATEQDQIIRRNIRENQETLHEQILRGDRRYSRPITSHAQIMRRYLGENLRETPQEDPSSTRHNLFHFNPILNRIRQNPIRSPHLNPNTSPIIYINPNITSKNLSQIFHSPQNRVLSVVSLDDFYIQEMLITLQFKDKHYCLQDILSKILYLNEDKNRLFRNLNEFNQRNAEIITHNIEKFLVYAILTDDLDIFQIFLTFLQENNLKITFLKASDRVIRHRYEHHLKPEIYQQILENYAYFSLSTQSAYNLACQQKFLKVAEKIFEDYLKNSDLNSNPVDFYQNPKKNLFTLAMKNGDLPLVKKLISTYQFSLNKRDSTNEYYLLSQFPITPQNLHIYQFFKEILLTLPLLSEKDEKYYLYLLIILDEPLILKEHFHIKLTECKDLTNSNLNNNIMGALSTIWRTRNLEALKVMVEVLQEHHLISISFNYLYGVEYLPLFKYLIEETDYYFAHVNLKDLLFMDKIKVKEFIFQNIKRFAYPYEKAVKYYVQTNQVENLKELLADSKKLEENERINFKKYFQIALENDFQDILFLLIADNSKHSKNLKSELLPLYQTKYLSLFQRLINETTSRFNLSILEHSLENIDDDINDEREWEEYLEKYQNFSDLKDNVSTAGDFYRFILKHHERFMLSADFMLREATRSGYLELLKDYENYTPADFYNLLILAYENEQEESFEYLLNRYQKEEKEEEDFKKNLLNILYHLTTEINNGELALKFKGLKMLFKMIKISNPDYRPYSEIKKENILEMRKKYYRGKEKIKILRVPDRVNYCLEYRIAFIIHLLSSTMILEAFLRWQEKLGLKFQEIYQYLGKLFICCGEHELFESFLKYAAGGEIFAKSEIMRTIKADEDLEELMGDEIFQQHLNCKQTENKFVNFAELLILAAQRKQAIITKQLIELPNISLAAQNYKAFKLIAHFDHYLLLDILERIDLEKKEIKEFFGKYDFNNFFQDIFNVYPLDTEKINLLINTFPMKISAKTVKRLLSIYDAMGYFENAENFEDIENFEEKDADEVKIIPLNMRDNLEMLENMLKKKIINHENFKINHYFNLMKTNNIQIFKLLRKYQVINEEHLQLKIQIKASNYQNIFALLEAGGNLSEKEQKILFKKILLHDQGKILRIYLTKYFKEDMKEKINLMFYRLIYMNKVRTVKILLEKKIFLKDNLILDEISLSDEMRDVLDLDEFIFENEIKVAIIEHNHEQNYNHSKIFQYLRINKICVIEKEEVVECVYCKNEELLENMIILECGGFKHFHHLDCLYQYYERNGKEKTCLICFKEFEWKNCQKVIRKKI